MSAAGNGQLPRPVEDNFFWSQFAPSDGEESLEVRALHVDYKYLQVYEHDLLNGRFYDEEMLTDTTVSIVVNETFVKQMGLENPVGTYIKNESNLRGAGQMQIIGVVEDFHFESLHTEIEPAVFYIIGDQYAPTRYISVKFDPIQTNIKELISKAESLWSEIQPAMPIEYSFLDDRFDQIYKSEHRWKEIIYYASGISILIACLGLLGLANLTLARRKKEIGIRKVLGATISSLTLLLSKDFLKPVMAALILALPATYYLLENWLQNFAYRSISVLCLLFLLLVLYSL